jgi:hypothetical protein
MCRGYCKFVFRPGVSLENAEESLLLAVLAAEGIHGRSRVRLDATFRLRRDKRTCIVDVGTQVGRHIAQIFTGFLAREFGEQAYRVRRRGSRAESKKEIQREEAIR